MVFSSFFKIREYELITRLVSFSTITYYSEQVILVLGNSDHCDLGLYHCMTCLIFCLSNSRIRMELITLGLSKVVT